MTDEERVVGPKDENDKRAPSFELPDDQGRIVRLRDFQGEHSLVLYFARSFG